MLTIEKSEGSVDLFSQVVAGPPKYHYRLHSVVRHLGSSPLAGHYIADVFRSRLELTWVHNPLDMMILHSYFDRFDTGGWWRYDDSQVTQTRWI